MRILQAPQIAYPELEGFTRVVVCMILNKENINLWEDPGAECHGSLPTRDSAIEMYTRKCQGVSHSYGVAANGC